MRKALISVLLLGLVAGAMSAVPATAKKKKKTVTVSEESRPALTLHPPGPRRTPRAV